MEILANISKNRNLLSSIPEGSFRRLESYEGGSQGVWSSMVEDSATMVISLDDIELLEYWELPGEPNSGGILGGGFDFDQCCKWLERYLVAGGGIIGSGFFSGDH